MGQHWSHLTPTKRIQLDAFIRAGMKPTDIAKELGVHHTTIYRELKRCTYEHLNSDYTTETRYNPEGAQARYEANLRAKGPELKIDPVLGAAARSAAGGKAAPVWSGARKGGGLDPDPSEGL